MSTPPGKPGPIDLSAYVSHKARELAATERETTESDDTHLRSPYAPKKASERAGSAPPPAASGPEKPPSDDHDHRDPLASGGGIAPVQPTDLDGLAARYSAPAGNHAQYSGPVAGRGHEPPFTERDIERLESSLRWLQREEEAARLLRSTRKPAAHAPPEAGDDRGNRSPRRLQSPRSLEPEHLVPPPELSSGRSRWPLAVALASAFGAGVAYYFAAGDATPPSAPTPRPQVASFDSKTNATPSANSVAKTSVAPPAVSLDRQAFFPAVARDDDAAASATELSSARAKSSRLAKLPEPPAAAAPPAIVEAAPASKPVRALDPEEIKLLVKQGDQLVAAGDMVTARVVFQRAAEAGDANAAMALGATYDPAMLAKLGVVGVIGDVERARTWYQKAENLGAPEATRRLGLLANR
jgi:hypothetical protein